MEDIYYVDFGANPLSRTFDLQTHCPDIDKRAAACRRTLKCPDSRRRDALDPVSVQNQNASICGRCYYDACTCSQYCCSWYQASGALELATDRLRKGDSVETTTIVSSNTVDFVQSLSEDWLRLENCSGSCNTAVDRYRVTLPTVTVESYSASL